LAESEAARSSASQPRGEDSKGIWPGKGRFWAGAVDRLRASGPVGWTIFGLGLVGAILLIVAEFSNLRHTTVITATCHDLAGPDADKCSRTGGQQHHYGLIPLAVLLLAMSWGAAVGRSRPAAGALIAIGVVVLVIGVAFDLPDARKAGVLSEDFSNAKEHPGAAIPLELVGGVLAIASGAVALRRRPPPGEGDQAAGNRRAAG
jgi:hypothetical protein